MYGNGSYGSCKICDIHAIAKRKIVSEVVQVQNKPVSPLLGYPAQKSDCLQAIFFFYVDLYIYEQ